MTFSGTEPYLLVAFDEEGIHGTVSIAPALLVEMIAVTVEAIPDVTKVANPGRGSSKRHPVLTDGGDDGSGENWYSGRGISVVIDEHVLKTSLHVSMRQGASVPDVAATIQEQVGIVVEKMLGLRTESVAVHVSGFEPESSQS